MQIDLAELVRRTGTFRRKTFTAGAIEPTRAQGADLLRIYMRVVRGWQERFRDTILPEYARSLSELITDDAGTLNTTIGISERQMAQLAAAAGQSVDEWISTTEAWHRKRFAQAFNPTGVKIGTLLDRNDVANTLQSVLGENVALIRSLDDQVRSGISGAVFRGLQARTPARDVAREVRRIAGVGQSRAELIAADQLQKLTGALDEQRQRQAGIGKFEWMHSHKKTPRPEHVARDGKVYAWTDPVAKTDPPGRAIRCGCRARAVVEIDEQVETAAAPEPTPAPAPAPPPPPPEPPKPAPRRFRSPINPDVNDDTVPVRGRLALQKEMRGDLADGSKHPFYAAPENQDSWQHRGPKDYGNASFSADWTDEAVSTIAAVRPELDALADQIGIPRIRGFKTTSASQNADMADGVMGLNAAEFNARTAHVGGRGGAEAAADAARAESEKLYGQQIEIRDEINAVSARLREAAYGTDAWRTINAERTATVKRYESLARKRKKLSQAAGRANRIAATETPVTWKPGDAVAARPWSVAQYQAGINKVRSTLFHEFAHHVHQTLKKTEKRRLFDPERRRFVDNDPPLERRLTELFRATKIGPEREAFLNRQPSTYATANEKEWFAENFAAFVMGRRDIVDPVLLELIEDIFSGAF